ncbi:CoA-binding protein [Albibacterium sp.]|uniref:CoA-binding protein n=1 Tax=Albibacterium sp. TaxID=2952885 RepID=UPI002C532E3B|nr:CoA-binding protein [Albibacterium sp.]HUH20119.1 CoA-binding protein [Albibacterium sp.]
MKKTMIIGATPNIDRYANKAATRLVYTGHKIVNIGVKKGEAAGKTIEKADKIYNDIHTITLYIGSQIQKEYYDYILKTKPKRLIFNPGAENPELYKLAEENGIEATNACTLVLLASNQF